MEYWGTPSFPPSFFFFFFSWTLDCTQGCSWNPLIPQCRITPLRSRKEWRTHWTRHWRCCSPGSLPTPPTSCGATDTSLSLQGLCGTIGRGPKSSFGSGTAGEVRSPHISIGEIKFSIRPALSHRSCPGAIPGTEAAGNQRKAAG